ncbi:putative uncharacterized protein DDB_G0287457 isoform X2 [Panonychus citri]|uniref:putative uncharacterized protein DDB_G0287457 isoform X2 n=1 Tax=Panonychus citri TaxID=50023 RepID=UPI00230757CF|nr:putative uncharacterized protein DDB_G0287457 isoform X2 [Panonychus citri]
MDLTHRPAKLCILSKWSPHFEGYGFDLMTKKSGEGHYISMVHEGGPAEATHLEAGDWLVEVNGVNVEKFTHAEVIKLIKGSENGSVQLLLAPNETDKWRKRNQVPITSSHPDLVHYITPPYQGRSPNGRTNSITMRRSTNDDEQLAGSLDEQRQKEIADWRDKSLEMLMASRVDEEQEDEDEDSNVQDENEISIFSHHQDESTYKRSENGNNSRPISGYQEKVLVDIHLTDNNCNNNSDTSNDNNNNTNNNNNGHKDDNNHITTITLLDGEFFARFCKISKSSERSDYGFKMDSLPSGGGHFLRSIEPTGPAGVSGIQQDDRLIEVNNVNVEYTDHDTVVTMIRKSPDCEVTLLVVDDKAYKWFKSRNIRIHHGTGGSLIRYCDHRGLREPGYNFERPVSMVEENRRSQLYRRGLSSQSAIGDDRSAGNSSDVDIESDAKNEDKHLPIELRNHHSVDANNKSDDESIGRDDQVTTRQSIETTVTTSTDTRGSSGLDQQQKQQESRSSQISDWSYGSLSDVDRFNRGKTIIKVPDDAPRPRLCSITKDPEGIFGFTLNTYEKGRIKLIADIDQGSSAEAAGLLQWDRVIEVNGVNINIENHAQVTGRIEASGNRLHLLVLPEAQYGWYERAGLVPRSNQSNVIYLSNTDVTRDSITIARSLEHSVPLIYNRKSKTNSKQNSPKKSSSSPTTITTTTTPSTTMTTSTPESTSNNEIKGSSSITTDNNNDKTDNYDDSESQLTMEMIKMRKEDQIKKPFQSNVNSYKVNEDNDGNESNGNSTISPTIQYHTIDEETTEAIYDHRETHEVATLPLRKPKKKSLTKRIFRGSIFSSKKDKLYTGSGSISNLSVKSDIVMRGSSSVSDLTLDAKSRTLKRSVTQLNNRLDEDEINEYQLPQDIDQDRENNVVTVMVKRNVQPITAWSTSNNNNNNHKIVSEIHDNNNGFSGHQDHLLTKGEGDDIVDQQDESQLLERLKSLTLRDVRKTTRAESKIQAYQRMSSLNFSQRIKHFEDL